MRSPSPTLAARLIWLRSASLDGPPAAAMASVTRPPPSRRTTPGFATAPATCTTTSPVVVAVDAGAASARGRRSAGGAEVAAEEAERAEMAPLVDVFQLVAKKTVVVGRGSPHRHHRADGDGVGTGWHGTAHPEPVVAVPPEGHRQDQ